MRVGVVAAIHSVAPIPVMTRCCSSRASPRASSRVASSRARQQRCLVVNNTLASIAPATPVALVTRTACSVRNEPLPVAAASPAALTEWIPHPH